MAIFILIAVTSDRDDCHRHLRRIAAKCIQLMGVLPERKANETHWHAVGRGNVSSLLSPRHLGKASRRGPVRLASTLLTERAASVEA